MYPRIEHWTLSIVEGPARQCRIRCCCLHCRTFGRL